MIRVLRMIEIEYESMEEFDKDSSRWALPATGVRQFNDRSIYRCATIIAPLVEASVPLVGE